MTAPSPARRAARPALICASVQMARIAQSILPDYESLSIQLGDDLEQFTDREVLVWPDEDVASRSTMSALAGQLFKVASKVRVINPDGGFTPEHYTGFSFKDDVRDHLHQIERPVDNARKVVPAIKPEPTIADKKQTLGGLKLQMDSKFIPLCNVQNAREIFNNYAPFVGKFWFDSFLNKIMCEWHDEKDTSTEPQEITEALALTLTAYLQRNMGLSRWNDAMISKGIIAAAEQNRRDTMQHWISGLTWDGVARIDGFSVNYLGAEDSLYHEQVSKNFWLGLAARASLPCSKVDNMVVLEGKQGTMKSTALRIIGGPYYMESHYQMGTNDFALSIQGKLIVEIAELDSMSRAETTTIKRVLSQMTDRFRKPYGYDTQDYPRRSIMVGTTNEDDYLKDSENRRFHPLVCGKINLEALTADREQLYAEALHRINAGESWHEMPRELIAPQHEAKREEDAWEAKIYDYIKWRTSIKTDEILGPECLDIDRAQWSQLPTKRIGKILRRAGWFRTRISEKGYSVQVWKPTDIPMPASP